MATDFGPASGNGEIQIGANVTAAVFIEQHIATLSTPLSTGVPGGLLAPSSALNNLGPADHSYQDVSAYGTKPDGSSVTPVFNLGGTSASGPVNPSGAGNLNLFRFKNPGIFEFVAPEF